MDQPTPELKTENSPVAVATPQDRGWVNICLAAMKYVFWGGIFVFIVTEFNPQIAHLIDRLGGEGGNFQADDVSMPSGLRIGHLSVHGLGCMMFFIGLLIAWYIVEKRELKSGDKAMEKLSRRWEKNETSL